MLTAIIIPCYNEARRLNVDQFLRFVQENEHIELWFANDGSTDETLSVISRLSDERPERIHIFNLEKNAGKAEVLRLAFLHVFSVNKYTHIGFIDADLSSPLGELIPLIEQYKLSPDKVLVTGVRIKMLGNNIVRSATRHYISRIFATLYNTILHIPNYDTQCGLKLFNAKFIPDVFKNPFISKWLFDIELFLRIQGMVGRVEYERCVKEVPVNEWREVGGSKLRTRDFFKAPLEVLRIRRRYINIIKS